MNIIERNAVRVSGRGQKTMIFAHGYGCSQEMWRKITPAFERDHQIVLFDHVGSGNSDLSAYDRVKYGTLQGYATDILEICDALDLRDSIFVGHSVSAMVGILASIREPSRFSNLVLVGPSPHYLNEPGYTGGFDRPGIDGLLRSLEADQVAWSSAMVPVIMGNQHRPELGQELAESFCRVKPEIAQHFAQVTFLSDNRADLPKVRTPSLILQCRNDSVAPEAVGEYIARNLRGSELKLMNASGHCPHLSAPEETIAAIQDYLGRSALRSAA